MNLSEIRPDADPMPVNLHEVTDELLVSIAQSGDAWAFVLLSQRHSRRILLKIYRMTNDWQDAEDVMQDSLIRAFTHLHAFESRASFSTWLTSIAINTALMLLRKKRSSLRYSIDSSILGDDLCEVLEPRDHRDNPEQCYAQRQAEDRVRKAVKRLRPNYREVIELRGMGDLPMSEIARSLRISEAAVKSRLLRARKELRRHIQ